MFIKIKTLTVCQLFISILTLMFLGNQNSFAESSMKKLKIGDLEQNKLYGIKVIEAEEMNKFEDMHGTVEPVDSSNKLIAIIVKFYQSEKPLKDKNKAIDEMRQVSLFDKEEQKYPLPLTQSNNIIFRYILIGINPKEIVEKEGFSYQIFFSVPKERKGFCLKYRDLSKIDLGL
jgi:hypothetical protein